MKFKTARLSTAAVFVLILAGCPGTPREQQALDDLANSGVIISYALANRCGPL